jgi:polysaccharide pyruvyl transferase WcaK-like protein
MITGNTSVMPVAFFWQTFTSSNLGVAALAESNLSIVLEAAKRADLTISPVLFCHSEKSGTTPKSGVTVGDPMSFKGIATGRSRFLRQLRQCSLAIDIGEGDSFSDIYGMKRLLLLVSSKFFSVRCNVPLVIAPQTIGPFSSWIARAMARFVMNRATHVFARDGLSMSYLRDSKVSAPTSEVIDVAFRLPFSKSDKFSNDGRTHVGVNVSGLLFNGGYTQNNQFGLTVDYRTLVTDLLDELNSSSNVQVHLVSHVIADDFPIEDDYRVALELKKKYPNFDVAPKFTSPSEAKSYISRLDFFTGARMHACIGAFSSGVPVVPMAYSRKFNGLFHSLGYRHIADLKADSTDSALKRVLDGFQNRESLAHQVSAGNAIAQFKLKEYEDYLTDFFIGLKRDGRN